LEHKLVGNGWKIKIDSKFGIGLTKNIWILLRFFKDHLKEGEMLKRKNLVLYILIPE